MKKIVPHVGNRFTYKVYSLSVPKEVPKDAIREKLKRTKVPEVELFSQAEMNKLRNQFRRNLSRRGAKLSDKQSRTIFKQIMEKVAKDIDTDFQKRGLGHVIGEDRHFKDGRDSQEWFYVLNWPSGRKIRERFGFDDADFHLTLGMTGNGVDNIRKDDTTLLDDDKLDYREEGLKTLFVGGNDK
jgi:hypothetical protein